MIRGPLPSLLPMSAAATLIAMLLLATAVLGWQLLRGMHERAMQVAVRSCREAGVQLLDATVALQQLRLAREDGQFGWRMDYGFDISADGQQRRSGRIRFHRGALKWVEMPRDGSHRDLWIAP
jgi:hypothetical protein